MIFLERHEFLANFSLSITGGSYNDQRGSLSWGTGKIIYSMSHSNVFRGLHRHPACIEKKNVFVLDGAIREFIFMKSDDDMEPQLFISDLLKGDSFSVPEHAFHGFYCWTTSSIAYVIETDVEVPYDNVNARNTSLLKWLSGRGTTMSDGDRLGLIKGCEL